jgi:hypothetical protein
MNTSLVGFKMYFCLTKRGFESGIACHIDNRCNIVKLLDIDMKLAFLRFNMELYIAI